MDNVLLNKDLEHVRDLLGQAADSLALAVAPAYIANGEDTMGSDAYDLAKIIEHLRRLV